MSLAWRASARIGCGARQRRPATFAPSNLGRQPRRSLTGGTVQTLIYAEKPKADALFLRDSCRCSLCVDPSTQQKHFHVSELPAALSPTSAVTADGQLEVRWGNDLAAWRAQSHVSRYSRRYLQQLLGGGRSSDAGLDSWAAVLWDAAALESARAEVFLEHEAYVGTEAGLDRAVAALLRYGICFIQGVPASEASVKALAARIGPLRNTFYGETWDVRSVPAAKNVAYTSQHLGFHQDLMYMAHPPDLQLLHVLRASAPGSGGESLFADGARAVAALQRRPDWADLLPGLLTDVTYRYANDGHWYQQRRPVLQKSGGGAGSGAAAVAATPNPAYPRDFDAINWSPQFQGPFALAPEDLERYARATRALRQELEADRSVFELAMPPGTCAVFNNRRIMHARRAFDASASGERWLRGAYVDWDPLMSRWREARRKAGEITPGDEVRAA